jgi:lipopolysaccharide cholinephosphotransferase
MMTIESFEKLKRIRPENVVDMSFYTNNKNLTVSFVYNDNDISSPQPYIQIRILIPTSVKKVYRYKSILFYLKNKIQNKSLNLKNSINNLYHKEFQGYFLLTARRKRIEYS